MYKPIKELGQNFLTDVRVAQDMVKALEFDGSTDLIEIGPGHGMLTHLLAHKIEDTNSLLYTVEIDSRLSDKISKMFLENLNVRVFCEDVLEYLPNFEPEKKFSIIGSLPYYITSPILHKVIKMKNLPESCAFLVQKEVAEKISNKAPDATYLSSFIQTFFDVFYLGQVEAKKFDPVPEVDGGIIKLKKRTTFSKLNPEFIEKYEGFLHRAFSHPRKMLNKAFSSEELIKGNVSPNLRAQNLDAAEWLSFFKILNPNIKYEI